ncbi:MAG: TetR/AcrR family transcriptional regulator, partial [Actinomycetota bacterium]
LIAHPDHLRIHEWRRLEHPDATELEQRLFAEKVNALSAVRPAYGTNDRFSPADVIVVVVALASAWVSAPTALRHLATHDTDRQRALIAGSVRVLAEYQPDKNTTR